MPPAYAAPQLVGHVAHQEQQHQRENEAGEDQQEPVKTARHRHRILKPAVPGESAQLRHTATTSVAQASLGAASIRAVEPTGR